MASVAGAILLPHVASAQVAPPGAVIDLGTGTPSSVDTYTQYSTTVTAATTGASYVLFAFREVPAFFYFDDASVTLAGTSINLLTNPGFEDGSTPSTADSGIQVPVGWGTVYQTGSIPSAPGTTLETDRSHSGSYVWYDGSVEHFDGIYQVLNTVVGQQYNISFWLNADNAYTTPTIEMLTYFGACDTSGGGCNTALGSGFTVTQPPTSNPTIETVHGDIAPNIFSLSTPAAQAANVEFDGGTLRMTGGDFPNNIITAPVLITATDGTVDTSTGNGGFTGVVSGPGSLTLIGGGTFALTGANTYSGGTFLDAGTVAIGNATALGTGLLTMSDGTTLGFVADGLTVANAIVFGSVIPSGPTADPTIDTGSFAETLTGTISGTGALTKQGIGKLTLTAANTYTGGTTIAAGVLAVADDAALGTGTLTFGAASQNNAATVTASGPLTLQAAVDGLTIVNPAMLASDGTIDTQGFGLTYAGTIGGTGALTKVGTGTLTLPGSNSYGGGTDIANGTIAIGANDSLGTGTITFDGGTLQAAVDGLTITNAATIASVGTIDTQGYGMTYAGLVSGGGSLTKIGAGTLTLPTANTYGGGTTLTAGTIAIGDSAALGTGALTFGGGTLQAAADGLTVANAAVFAAGGTIDTQGFGLTYAGTMSGAGGLDKIGSGTLLLTAANSYGGGTDLDAGTIGVANSAALGTGALTFRGGVLQAAADGLSLANAAVLASNGTVDTQAFSLAMAGTVSGSGQLTKIGAGTLALTAANSYGGGTVVQSGTLAIANSASLGTGALTLDDGTTLRFLGDGLNIGNAVSLPAADPTIDTGNGTVTMSGPITGPGALTKIGSGTLDLTGTNTYSGATTVAAGTLLIDGSTANSTATVQSGATLGGHGTIGALIVQSGATVSPGAASALTVAGNATFQAGSTYQVTVNPNGTNSKLAVGGTAAVGGATLSVLAGTGTFTAATYTLLTAANGVTGTFSTVNTASSLALLRPTVGYDPNDVTLTLNPVTFASIATTPNQAAVAAAIQALGPSSPLYQAVLTQTTAGAQQAFTAAAGIPHADNVTTVVASSRVMTGLIVSRLWDLNGGGLSARQAVDQFAPDSGMPALVRCYGPVPDPVPAPAPHSYTAWGEAFGTFGHNDASANAGSLDRTLGGFVLGIDTPLDGTALGSNSRVGVAAGYTNTTYTSAGQGSGTVQGVFGSLYGGARFGALDMRAGTTVGGNFNDGQRTVAFPGFFETERSSSSGYSAQGFGEVGYRLASSTMAIEPVAGGSIVHVHQDAFSEKGGAAALNVAALDNDLATTSLGIRGEMEPIKGVPLLAHGYLAWQHTIGNVAPASILAFEANPGQSFSITGAPIDRDAVVAELALDYRASTAVDLGLSYNGIVGATAADHSVKGRMEYHF